MTVQRIFAILILTAFPPIMLFLVLFSEGGEFSILMTSAMVLFIGLLSLLLWATPNVHGELEGRSWSYVTSRNNGRYSVLLGKYLNSVIWAVLVGWTSITLCSIEMKLFAAVPEITKIWLSLSLLVFIAAPVYGAIFSMIGVIFSRRSMVFGAAYIIISEMVLAGIPANVNKLTGAFHLFCVSTWLLGWEWLPVDRSEWENLYGRVSVFWSLTFLALITFISLGISASIIRWREYITSDETI